MAVAEFQRLVKTMQHLASAFDHVPGHVASVGLAYIRHGFAADQPTQMALGKNIFNLAKSC